MYLLLREGPLNTRKAQKLKIFKHLLNLYLIHLVKNALELEVSNAPDLKLYSTPTMLAGRNMGAQWKSNV